MISSEHFNAIAALDLEPIKVKLMHVESGEGWSLEKVDAVEFEYRRFLYLMKMFPQEQTAPLMDVDIFWHYHILDTMKYALDCEAVFGYFLHHFPYIGLRGEDDEAAHRRVGDRMKELYEETFGEPYGIGAHGGAAPEAAYSGRVSDQTAYSGRVSAEATAYSGRVAAPAAGAAVAYSGRVSASNVGATAYSGRVATAYSGRVADQTAYSGRIGTQAAYSGRVADQTAYSGRVSTETAYSGRVSAETAYSGRIQAAAPGQDAFYSARPRLAAD
ncbi:glycine-rich domain-containing protein [Pseudoduganella armeniaca]|uniref:glycine-rich domain-containing protein n=1 Tax=Pseudoduganella armeniaca TaxID=2072590 RepID=UPI000D16824B|nr:glycine-rich domain-containing protein-like [Pseudoduganella armeniaca]